MSRASILASIFPLTLASAMAVEVTPEAISSLPDAEQADWKTYLETSRALALADEQALKAELAANNMAIAIKAPSGGDFKLPEADGPSWFAGVDAGKLADIILSYQAPCGGWSKHTGYSRGPRLPGMQWTSQSEPGAKPHYLATFDNRSTTEQLNLLARVWHATKREDCKTGFIRGLDFILAAQFPNGGWPQVFPLEGGYHDNITFNDDAMAHILALLRDVAGNDPVFSMVADDKRAKSAAAFEKGLRCVVKSQFIQNGKKTAWCAQHDPFTLAPAEARKMEPASLSGMESASMVAFLMTLKNPAPEIMVSIESGLEWLDRVKITGLSKSKVDGKTAYVADSASTEVYWARFYDLDESRPLFPGRDGVIYNSFGEMADHNKLGYDFYTTRPGSILKNGQKKWRKMLAGK